MAKISQKMFFSFFGKFSYVHISCCAYCNNLYIKKYTKFSNYKFKESELDIKIIGWIVGFLEGDGSFGSYLANIKNKKGLIVRYELSKEITLALSMKDKNMVYDIKKILENAGNIYLYPNKGFSGEIRYKISKKEELLKTIKILDLFLF